MTEYTNPILPGWNSDPSCVFVPSHSNTLFCTTSSFLAYPGIPIYASKDFVHWKLASHAIAHASQLPELAESGGGPGPQSEGIWASTLRHRAGVFYLITTYINVRTWDPKILLFTTTDPFKNGWDGPLHLDNPGRNIDPDLFWDDDGKAYVAVAKGIFVTEMDLGSGKAVGETFTVWNGTGGRNPEGPHLYRKDGWYYLLIGEGGTETGHAVTMARSRNLKGPYEGHEGNPVLTARGTKSYFQTVGHADLFEDGEGKWWAVALSTRSGPEWVNYPMGRETVLVPVRWEEGEWPVFESVRGTQVGPLPRVEGEAPGSGPRVGDPDVVDFEPGSGLPRQFVHWRIPKGDLLAVSPPGHPGTLRILPSRVDLTSDADYQPTEEGLGFVARKQTATKFRFSVDVSINPVTSSGEAGISVFLTQLQHIDLSITGRSRSQDDKDIVPHLKFSVEASGKPNETIPATNVVPIPSSWLSHPIRLTVEAIDEYRYALSAASSLHPSEAIQLGYANATIVSGGSGPFTGTIVGVFNTKNRNKDETAPAYFSRWRYTPVAQAVDEGAYIAAES
ncbi:hypothetical protein BU23DRAFT_528234 [Bimuria novae-zelandiae CBS 107.79]|uniref:Beta-xylosidase C-terminal Concanavalin A-like domain-containing protein n=1 Tax=Bimuria novae-zelandiae CBS 107.79 TaxID=1447943 RepID=A0A6A5VG92_9PLEO|nr:hypothetical protein BU23DRAFT_528234 [Bimuria novae-zelandiae CBS 107.79]